MQKEMTHLTTLDLLRAEPDTASQKGETKASQKELNC
jgi:hypothetical protein